MVRNHLQKRALFLDATAELKDSSGVDAEFNSLETKVAQFVGLCERLRAENHDLRQQLATAKNDAKRLNERIEGAKLKLESLLAYLDGKMGEIKKAGKVSGADRIAVMAALNIAHEFLSTKLGSGFDIGQAKGRILTIEAKLDEALAKQDKLF
jgi:cell division protein ZapA